MMGLSLCSGVGSHACSKACRRSSCPRTEQSSPAAGSLAAVQPPVARPSGRAERRCSDGLEPCGCMHPAACGHEPESTCSHFCIAGGPMWCQPHAPWCQHARAWTSPALPPDHIFSALPLCFVQDAAGAAPRQLYCNCHWHQQILPNFPMLLGHPSALQLIPWPQLHCCFNTFATMLWQACIPRQWYPAE